MNRNKTLKELHWKRELRTSIRKALPALLKISKTKTYQASGEAQIMFMAAVVEIIEPSNTVQDHEK